MDLEPLLDSVKFRIKVEDLIRDIQSKPKNKIKPEDIKERLEDIVDAVSLFNNVPLVVKDTPALAELISKKKTPPPPKVDHKQILLDAKSKGATVLYLPDISQGEIHKLWTEVGMPWNPNFQSTGGGWKITANVGDLKSGTMG